LVFKSWSNTFESKAHLRVRLPRGNSLHPRKPTNIKN
jgi:hypothetical protein